MMMVTTIHMLKERMVTQQTLACVGLDPDLNRIPNEVRALGLSAEDTVLHFLTRVIDITAEHVCAYKAQKAFFDLLSGGHDLLRNVIAYVHLHHPGIPVIVDCKVGDIDNTMDVYLQNLFGLLNADGVIVNPYMGEEVIQATMQYSDKGIVVLCKTSNPGSSVTQDVILQDGYPLWEYILNLTVNRWNNNHNMIPVISSTAGLNLKRVRLLIPPTMPILLAGVGAQGGSYAQVANLLDPQGIGVFINSSRGILYPPANVSLSWQENVEAAAVRFKNALNQARKVQDEAK